MSHRDVTLRSADLMASSLPACPDCGDLAHPSATVCDGCGTHLYLRVGSGTPFTGHSRQPQCKCGGRGLCVVCVLRLLDEGHAL